MSCTLFCWYHIPLTLFSCSFIKTFLFWNSCHHFFNHSLSHFCHQLLNQNTHHEMGLRCSPNHFTDNNTESLTFKRRSVFGSGLKWLVFLTTNSCGSLGLRRLFLFLSFGSRSPSHPSRLRHCAANVSSLRLTLAQVDQVDPANYRTHAHTEVY